MESAAPGLGLLGKWTGGGWANFGFLPARLSAPAAVVSRAIESARSESILARTNNWMLSSTGLGSSEATCTGTESGNSRSSTCKESKRCRGSSGWVKVIVAETLSFAVTPEMRGPTESWG
jgi:hypothetical protein